MMKIKVSEATGVVLDWLVAKCEGLVLRHASIANGCYMDHQCEDDAPSAPGYAYSPSTEWSQGGPIIDREGIGFYKANASRCWAHPYGGDYKAEGKTPLIATMRCFVISKLGEEVEVPDELIKETT